MFTTPTLWTPQSLSERVHCCLLPASLRVANLFLHADGLTEEAVNVFEIHAAVCHALHGTAKTNRSMKVLTVTTAGQVGVCKHVDLCFFSPARVLYTVDGSLTLLLPALHVRLCERLRKIQPLKIFRRKSRTTLY